MMRRRRWWISVAILGIIGLVGLCPKSVRGVNENEPVDSLLVRDTIPLPSLAYSMRVGGDTLTLPDSCALWDSFFDALDSLRAGKDTIIHIVHLGDSHIQAGHLSGRVMRLFPPVVTGPIIILIGLILAPSAITNCQANWLLAVITMLLIIGCNIWGKGMIKIIPILIGIVGAYIIALIVGWVDYSGLATAAAVGIPPFTIAKFSGSAILTMAPIALATMMEHVGDISAISATCGRNFIANPGLHRTLLGDGLATSLAGLVGGPANTTYGENTGVLALSKVYDPKVIQIAAVVAVILSFSPWFDALVNTIPTAIIGGASFVLYGMISAIGVRNVVENQVDLTKSRNLIIAAVILVSGLGFNSVGGIQIGIVNLSGLATAAILGILLNAILPGKDYEFQMEEPEDAKA